MSARKSSHDAGNAIGCEATHSDGRKATITRVFPGTVTIGKRYGVRIGGKATDPRHSLDTWPEADVVKIDGVKP